MNNKLILISSIIISAIISFSAGYYISFKTKNNYNTILKKELSLYKEGSWIAKINDNKISREYLRNRVALYKNYIINQTKKSDPLIEDRVLKKLIDNFIVLKSALNSNIFNSKKSQSYLWLFLEESMVNYYLDFLIDSKNIKQIRLSQKEIEALYKKNKKIFDKKKLSQKKSFEIIEKQLKSINIKMRTKNQFLKRKVELGKLKKDKIIKINKE